MKKGINLKFNYSEQLLKVRDASTNPVLLEYFLNLILEIRKKLYNYITVTSNNEKKHIAYIVSIEIPTIIDYLYCIYNERDTYPCEKIINRYGYTIDDLLDNEIFQYIFG